jgi:predicted  nucleic acid-binding Zn-ribbon protein
VLDPAIPQFFAPGTASTWTPALLGAARVAYSDAKLQLDDVRDIVVVAPFVDAPVPVDWEHAEPAGFAMNELTREPHQAAAFEPVPAAASTPKKYAQWSKDFAQWVARSQTVELSRSPLTKLVSTLDETERDFRIRIDISVREQRDAELARVRERYAARLATAEDRLRRAEAAVQREQEQVSESKMQAGVSVAATIVGALLGRKAVSASTLGRATTAARGYSRVNRASQDVARAEAEVTALREKRDHLARALEQELQTIASQWEARDAPLERVLVKPKRGGVSLQLVALVWIPK